MKSTFEIVQPKGWTPPKGYANGIVAQGRQVFIAGQVGWNALAQFESDDFVAQVEQALKNVVDVLAAAGGEPRHLVRLNWYLTDNLRLEFAYGYGSLNKNGILGRTAFSQSRFQFRL